MSKEYHLCYSLQGYNQLPRLERERRYISEYMTMAFSRTPFSLNVPLGPLPTEITAQHGNLRGALLYRPSRPRIDATAWTDTVYWLIEAKIREAKAAIGDLLVYRRLAESTNDLPGYDGQEFRMRLVVPWALDWVKAEATHYKFELVEWIPAWVEDYVRERQNYFTQGYRKARDEKQQIRRALGVD